MKVTYIENLPLDGAGTMVNPAYKWLQQERTEYCDSISKAGELWYMFRGGFVHHSIDPTKIKRIDWDGASALIEYKRNAMYFPFSVRLESMTGKKSVAGYTDFSGIIRDLNHFRVF